ncbi:DUF6249 domain-containing protein [Sinomicrobium weinanense]|uniref:DUF6249 domain-containing protein n=1 Tax=Sinomicrobium weinanense TaxID=2842200 RepID=A0A926JNZ6_9FLAO|nr:DUF6249 domain-containing protein [Sinomicrobium weinanense]MBC9794731.1 hypothetical protein [Sinomicrobium weinanense]MBU3124990.1 hypothetical protein [Sinomicrobium weinanense]
MKSLIPVLIPLVVFGTIFGIFYLYYTTRNRERMALIEKGADADIFFSKNQKTAPVWKILILNLSLLLIGIGLGLFAGNLVELYGMKSEVAYPACILIMGGLGLFLGFHMSKKLD